MDPSKLEVTYLDGSLNLHAEEKSRALINQVAQMGTVESAEPINVVEIGPGGGAALDSLSRAPLRPETLQRLHIITVELFPSQSKVLKDAAERLTQKGAQVSQAIGDMTNLPFADSSIDIINASAVLHEVFSYAGGQEAVESALTSAACILKPEGKLLYRDVFGVEDDLHTLIEQTYTEASWKGFVMRFLPHFLRQAPHPYSIDEISVHAPQPGKDSELHLTCPKGLAREIQRHYITFRDHIWRTQAIDMWPTAESLAETDWVDDTFNKKIYFEVVDFSMLDGLEYDVDERGLFMDGENFDRLTDRMIGRAFSGDSFNPEVGQEFTRWLEREGSEVYIYGTPDGIAQMGASDTVIKQSGKSLQSDPAERLIYPRNYYTGYLANVLGTSALADAKLVMTFTASPQN